MSADMAMSLLGGTHEEAELRALIREYARSQDGYDARLYDLWEKWNDEFFEGLMVLLPPGPLAPVGRSFPA